MAIRDNNIDNGKEFDFGRTSEEYSKYRDIYPNEFYKRIAEKGLCISGQSVLDLGTGTGVLPRNMYNYGAKWTGTDISDNQIAYAKSLAKQEGKKIEFLTCPSEEIVFPNNSFDVVTACQCFWYFDHKKLAPILQNILKPNGRLLILYMAWLPFEDKIARASEDLVLKYNPKWSGAGEVKKPIQTSDFILDRFDLVEHEEYNILIPFTKETWHGRMKTCRGVGASLSQDDISKWDNEHRTVLDRIAPNEFNILHYVSMAILEVR